LYHGAKRVKCRSCGHEIAKNAIVCYRCGAPTAALAPERPIAAGPLRGRRWLLVALVVAAVLCAALAVGLVRHLL